MKTLRTQTPTRTTEIPADDAMTRDSFEPAAPPAGSPAQRGGRKAGEAAGRALGAAAGAIGVAAGTVPGAAGAAGRQARRAFDPAAEDRYWQEQYRHEPYYDTALGYEDYAPAYRLGCEAHAKYPEDDFARIEERLRFEYEGASVTRLGWERAKHAARAAWRRVAQGMARGEPTSSRLGP